MSFHNKPDYHIPELIEALKAHRLPHDTPSQLADSFRIGWMARASHGQAPAQPDPAYSAACNLATALFKKYFAHLPDFASGQAVWSLCDSTAGVISQIDNMVSGLVQPPTISPQADSVQEDAALWHWLAEYLVGTRTDLDDEIVASETVNDLRKLVEAAIKQGATT